MRTVYKILIVVLLLLCWCGIAGAVDTAGETGKDKKQDKERSTTTRKSIEDRESEGTRTSSTTSKGFDRQSSEVLKDLGQAMQSSGADVTLSLEVVFLDRLAELERTDPRFRECGVVTRPRLPADFGLSGDRGGRTINLTRQENFARMAAANAPVPGDQAGLKQYMGCLTSYGAYIGQAYIYLTQDLAGIQGTVSKDRSGQITVRGMGYDDFVLLAEAALNKATADGGITNATIRRTHERAGQDCPMRWDRELSRISCGGNLMTLDTKPQLAIGGVPWYGEKFAGYAGSYKLSRAWSYSSALEALKSTAKFARYAEDVATFAENLESKGKTREAVLVRKKAVDRVRSGRNTVSPARLMQTPGQ